MSSSDDDIDNFDFSDEAAFNRRFRRVARSKSWDRILNSRSGQDCKSRITIYLDADIVDRFKEIGEKESVGLSDAD